MSIKDKFSAAKASAIVRPFLDKAVVTSANVMIESFSKSSAAEHNLWTLVEEDRVGCREDTSDSTFS